MRGVNRHTCSWDLPERRERWGLMPAVPDLVCAPSRSPTGNRSGGTQSCAAPYPMPSAPAAIALTSLENGTLRLVYPPLHYALHL